MKLTIETTIAPPTAVQNPSTCQPTPSSPATQEVSISIKALMTIRNSPRVSSTIGIVTIWKIGFRIALKTPKIRATTSMVSTFGSCRHPSG